jgi:hypothetical protein
MLSRSEYQEVLQMCREFAALRFDWERTIGRYYKRKYRPDQPRVPAGVREGGQWTYDGGGDASRRSDEDTSHVGGMPRVRLADASRASNPTVMSDAGPDSIIPGAQYAQTEIIIHTSALTGISTTDDTTKQLANTLARVKDLVNYLPDLGPALYGTEVHTAFATALRLQQLPGVEVEPTFGGPYYGAKDSVRPDAILRNDAGDIVAIYDVKTGESGIDPIRAARLRVNAGVGNDVPVIELSIPYGVRRKNASFAISFDRLFKD